MRSRLSGRDRELAIYFRGLTVPGGAIKLALLRAPAHPLTHHAERFEKLKAKATATVSTVFLCWPRRLELRAIDDGGLFDDFEPAPVTIALPASGTTVSKVIGDEPDIIHGHAITPLRRGVAIGGMKVTQGWSSATIRSCDGTNTLRWTASPFFAEGSPPPR